MSVYNAEIFLEDSIQSVLDQSFEDFEFIIINDGSTDCSSQILKESAKKDARIKLIEKENTGLTKSLNVGLKNAQGKYIARIDADDIWLEDKLATQIQYMKENAGCYLLGTNWSLINEGGDAVDSTHKIAFAEANGSIRDAIIRGNPFLHSSILYRKEVLSSVGLYNERFIFAQDYEYWVRILTKHNVANLPKILVLKRLSNKMLSKISEKQQRKCAIRAKLLAIQLLNLSKINYRYILNDLFVAYSPTWLTNLMRKYI